MVAELGRRRRPVGTCLVIFALVLLSRSSANMEGLQDQLMVLAAKNIELTQRLATVMATSTATPTPQQVLMPSVINTRWLKQPAAERSTATERNGRIICSCFITFFHSSALCRNVSANDKTSCCIGTAVHCEATLQDRRPDIGQLMAVIWESARLQK